jgi:hypothetical protein
MLHPLFQQTPTSINFVRLGLSVPIFALSVRNMERICGVAIPVEMIGSETSRGCKPFKFTEQEYNEINGKWIALLSDVGCALERKIDAMTKSGAAAIVVAYEFGSINEILSLKNTLHPVPIFGISYSYYTFLKEIIKGIEREERNNDIISNIEQYFSSAIIDKEMNLHRSPPFFVQVFLQIPPILTILLIFLLWKSFVTEGDTIQRRDNTIAIESIPLVTYKRGEDEMSAYSCAICLEEYQDEEQIRCLRCTHSYHKECIDPWLTKNNLCPVCRKNVYLTHQNSFTSTESSIFDGVRFF